VRPPPEPASDRRDLSRLEVVRAIEILYAIRRARSHRRRAGRARRALERRGRAHAIGNHRPPPRRPRMLLLGQSPLGTRTSARSLRLPDDRPSRISPHRPADEAAWPMPSPARKAPSIKDRLDRRAMGLMQDAAAGRYVAKKFNAPYDEKRLLSDQIYNVQLGAAELGRPHPGLSRLPTSSRSPATTPVAGGSRNGSPGSATRATRGPIRSIGSSRSPSPRRATTSSACSKISGLPRALRGSSKLHDRSRLRRGQRAELTLLGLRCDPAGELRGRLAALEYRTSCRRRLDMAPQPIVSNSG